MTDNQTPFDDYAKRPVPASELEDVPEDDYAKRPVAPSEAEEAPEDDYAKRLVLTQDEQPAQPAPAAPLQPSPAAPTPQEKPRRSKRPLLLIAACAVVVAGVALWQSGILDQKAPEPSKPTGLTHYTEEDVPDGMGVGVSTLPDWVADSGTTEAKPSVADAPAAEDAEATANDTASASVSYTGYVAGDFIFTPTSSSTCTLIGYQGDDTQLIIPATIGGYRVTRIEDYALMGHMNLKSIVIPEGVESIGDDVCLGCLYLESITIPPSVTTIGNYTFASYASLKTIYVTEGSYAHRFCAYYQVPYEFTNTGVEEAEAVAAGDYTIMTYSDGTCTITDYAGTAAQLTIPETLGGYRVTRIGYGAFYYCTSLESVIIPNGVTAIGERSFTIAML